MLDKYLIVKGGKGNNRETLLVAKKLCTHHCLSTKPLQSSKSHEWNSVYIGVQTTVDVYIECHQLKKSNIKKKMNLFDHNRNKTLK